MSTNRPDPSDRSDPLSREIDAALEGIDLQNLDQPARPAKAGAKGPGGKGAARGEAETRRGAVVGISGPDVFVELGPRMQGVLPIGEFDTPPAVGEVFEFTLHGREDDLWRLSRRRAQELSAGVDVAVGALVKARITGQNTGGLEARVGNVAAFLPASQVALQREENLAQYLNQVLVCEVREVDPAKRRIVLSRRAVLEKEREVAVQESVGRLSVGQTIQGRVTRVEPFGAFVDLGSGIEGLVHVSNLSHQRVESAVDKVAVGDTVQARIVKIEEGGRRIGLSMKALEADPWTTSGSRVQPDSVLQGTVKRVMDFGAFVEIEPGVEGLLHVSQISKDRLRRAQDALKVGETVQVRVLSVDSAAKRIALTRLDPRGALLGSDDSVDSHVIDQALRETRGKPLSTNLGNLFKQVLKDPPRP